jgi:hypothetical protein
MNVVRRVIERLKGNMVFENTGYELIVVCDRLTVGPFPMCNSRWVTISLKKVKNEL